MVLACIATEIAAACFGIIAVIGLLAWCINGARGNFPRACQCREGGMLYCPTNVRVPEDAPMIGGTFPSEPPTKPPRYTPGDRI